VSSRTQLASQVRGLLAEYGIVLPERIGQLRHGLPRILENAENELTAFSRRLFSSLYEELTELDEKIKATDEQIKAIYRASEPRLGLAAVEGIGPLTATALVAAMSDGKSFKNGRQFAAWLGLAPRQHSTGGKALVRNQQARRSLSANSFDSWRTLGGVSSESQVRLP